MELRHGVPQPSMLFLSLSGVFFCYILLLTVCMIPIRMILGPPLFLFLNNAFYICDPLITHK